MRRTFPHVSDVVIIGGGPSGLSLAAVLGAEGLGITVLERAQKQTQKNIRSDGRTLALSFRSVELLRRAGAWKHMERDACPIEDIRVADQDSQHSLDFQHREVGANPFGWIIETHLFHLALQKCVAQMKSVEIVYDAHTKAIEQDGAMAHVELGDGRVFPTMLIAACDGRKSLCREMAGIETYGWNYHQTAIVCLIKHGKPHHNRAIEHFQPGGPFATLPMTKQRSSIVWTEGSSATDALMKMERGAFTATLQSKVENYLGSIELLGERFSFPLHLQHAKRYISERLILIGDAAHGIHPIAGQGFNLGMGDIEALRDEILKALSLGLDLGHSTLLRSYEKLRKFDNGNMVLMTDFLDRLFSNTIPPIQAARRFGLGAIQKMPALRRFFMRTAMGTHR